jgi:hypothetical protein
VIERASVLLLLVDSAALADLEHRPVARRATRDLMERIGAVAAHPTLLVWAKHDVPLDDEARRPILDAFTTFLKEPPPIATSVDSPKTIEACFVKALDLAVREPTPSIPVEPRTADDPFLNYRAPHAR